MAASVPTWTLVLRCYQCGGKFTSHRLTLDKVTALPITAPCPYCGARPVVAPVDSPAATKMHGIFDLKEEAIRTYRKPAGEDTWHFSESCSKWPSESYIELDVRPMQVELCNECKCKDS